MFVFCLFFASLFTCVPDLCTSLLFAVGKVVIHKPHLNSVALMIKQVVGLAMHPNPNPNPHPHPHNDGSGSALQHQHQHQHQHSGTNPNHHTTHVGPGQLGTGGTNSSLLKSNNKLGKRLLAAGIVIGVASGNNSGNLRRGSFGTEKTGLHHGAAGHGAEKVDYVPGIEHNTEGVYAVDACVTLQNCLALDSNAFVIDRVF